MVCSASWLIRTRRVQSRRRRDGRRSLRSGRDRAEALRLAVAPASAGAATIHFAVIAQHFEDYCFGAFFVGVALLQLAWALLVVLRPVAPPLPRGCRGQRCCGGDMARLPDNGPAARPGVRGAGGGGNR